MPSLKDAFLNKRQKAAKAAKEKAAEKEKASGALAKALKKPQPEPKKKEPHKPQLVFKPRGKGAGSGGLSKAQRIADPDTVVSTGGFALPSIKDVVEDKNNIEALMVIFGQPEVRHQTFGRYVRKAVEDSTVKTALMQDEFWNGIERGIDKKLSFEERLYRTVTAIKAVLNGEGELVWQGDSVMEAMLNYAVETGILASVVEGSIPAFEILFRQHNSNQKIPRTDNELRDWILKYIDKRPGARTSKLVKAQNNAASALYFQLLENFSGVITDFFEEVEEMIKLKFGEIVPMQEPSELIQRLWDISYVMNRQVERCEKLVEAAVALNDPYSVPVYWRRFEKIIDRINILASAFNSLPIEVSANWTRDKADAKGATYAEKRKEFLEAHEFAIGELTEVAKQLKIWDGEAKAGNEMLHTAFETQKMMLDQAQNIEKWAKEYGVEVGDERPDQSVIDAINDMLRNEKKLKNKYE